MISPFAAGTIAKLIKEGYEGYLIRTTNDDHAGRGETVGDVVKNNGLDNQAVAKALGLKSFDLGYRNHMMDNYSMQDIRGRLIFYSGYQSRHHHHLRSLGHYEENPDHYVTAQAVEAACWMAGGGRDYPEHLEAGLKPLPLPNDIILPADHNCKPDRWYHRYTGNKIDANVVGVSQSPSGESGSLIRKQPGKRR